MIIAFDEFSIKFGNFNTPELARDFLLKFSTYNETYTSIKLHHIDKDEWFLFDKHGNKTAIQHERFT
jgi:hypothetical protein